MHMHMYMCMCMYEHEVVTGNGEVDTLLQAHSVTTANESKLGGAEAAIAARLSPGSPPRASCPAPRGS